MTIKHFCEKLNCEPQDLIEIDKTMEKDLKSSNYDLPEDLSGYWLIECRGEIVVGPAHYKMVNKNNPDEVWSISIGE